MVRFCKMVLLLCVLLFAVACGGDTFITNIYEINEDWGRTVATPVITVHDNSGGAMWVTMTTETPWALIWFTLDGSDPSSSNGDLFQAHDPQSHALGFDRTDGAVLISSFGVTMIKAIAHRETWNTSAIAIHNL